MATFFGEILPVLSRAVDDDDEEDAPDETHTNSNDSRKLVLRWSPDLRKTMSYSSDGKLRCRRLIFTVGCIPRAFVRRYIMSEDSKPVGVISCGLSETDRNTVTQQESDDASCFLYKFHDDSSSPTSLVCIWNPKATVFQEILAINRLFETLSPEGLEVVVLSDSHASNYKRPNARDDCSCVVRSLTTDRSKSPSPFPELEVPNILTGTPAAVMSHCQIYGISATVCVCYTDDPRPISANVDVFEPLLEAVHVIRRPKDTTSTSVLAARTSSTETSLYI